MLAGAQQAASNGCTNTTALQVDRPGKGNAGRDANSLHFGDRAGGRPARHVLHDMFRRIGRADMVMNIDQAFTLGVQQRLAGSAA